MIDTVERLRSVLAERYAIDCELGRGGMATVYLARDLKHNRSVAIKVLRPDLAVSIGSARFLREIRIASRLTHPNILPLYDSGTSDGLLFYVMPHVAGESLRERIRREGPLPVRKPSILPAKWRKHLTTPTRRTLSTATSSRATSCWRPVGR